MLLNQLSRALYEIRSTQITNLYYIYIYIYSVWKNFMFGFPSHALDSFPVLCVIFVFVKISLNFEVKYAVGEAYILLFPVPQPTNTCNAV